MKNSKVAELYVNGCKAERVLFKWEVLIEIDKEIDAITGFPSALKSLKELQRRIEKL